MKMSIKQWPTPERPREKLLRNGSNSLSNTELLAIVLGNGTTGKSAFAIAQELLQKFDGDLNLLARITPDELLQIGGIGQAKAVKLAAVFELTRRRTVPSDLSSIRSSQDAFSLLRENVQPLGSPDTAATKPAFKS